MEEDYSNPQRFCAPFLAGSDTSALLHRISCNRSIFFASSPPFDRSTSCHCPFLATFSDTHNTMKHIG